MRPMHQLPVPKEAKHEHETEGCNKCDEEFFPIHNVFVLEFSRSPWGPSGLHRKTASTCRSQNFNSQERRWCCPIMALHFRHLGIRTCFVIRRRAEAFAKTGHSPAAA